MTTVDLRTVEVDGGAVVLVSTVTVVSVEDTGGIMMDVEVSVTAGPVTVSVGSTSEVSTMVDVGKGMIVLVLIGGWMGVTSTVGAAIVLH
ncbi:hypothetical protein ONZ45_g17163 [Pleurotus djamor]|nr:hypothetical protein ONZ45_g17163 [Pleurotus djamor]